MKPERWESGQRHLTWGMRCRHISVFAYPVAHWLCNGSERNISIDSIAIFADWIPLYMLFYQVYWINTYIHVIDPIKYPIIGVIGIIFLSAINLPRLSFSLSSFFDFFFLCRSSPIQTWLSETKIIRIYVPTPPTLDIWSTKWQQNTPWTCPKSKLSLEIVLRSAEGTA